MVGQIYEARLSGTGTFRLNTNIVKGSECFEFCVLEGRSRHCHSFYSKLVERLKLDESRGKADESYGDTGFSPHELCHIQCSKLFLNIVEFIELPYGSDHV